MMGHDLVRPDAARHGALRMTDAALPISTRRGVYLSAPRQYSAAAAQRRPR